MGRWCPGPDRLRAAGGRRTPDPRARSGRDPSQGNGVRGVPHRPSPRRGRPSAPAARGDARPRGCGGRRRHRERLHPLRSRGSRRYRRGFDAPAATAGGAIEGQRTSAPTPLFTGWDADGGYAEWAVIDEAYAYALPDFLRRRVGRAAAVCRHHRLSRPCSGRSSRRAGGSGSTGSGPRPTSPRRSPWPRERPCTYGPVQSTPAVTRSTSVWPRQARPRTPHPSRSTRPSSSPPPAELVPTALAALDRGGTLAVAGIHLTDVPPLDYQGHLFHERQLRSVTANTRADGAEFLALAAARRVASDGPALPARRSGSGAVRPGAGRVTGAAVLVA